mmetsp:Transcript_94716/g.305774  ORF Transcript_94716/g.305774 Transcript_94716/m.305774 type:complete len:306 (-) Transcript_94716:222-1139(-)
MHCIVLEMANVAPPVRPPESPVLVDPVVQQRSCVDAAACPTLHALARGTAILKSPGDCGAARKAVAARARNLTLAPEALELCPVRPMESAMAVKLSVMEFALKPGTISECFLSVALYVIPLKRPLVPRPIRPSHPPMPLSDSIPPLSDVGNVFWPLHAALAVHAPMHPLPLENPTLSCALECTRTFLLATIKLADVPVTTWPHADASPVKGPLPELSGVRLSGRPGQLAFAPHHVLAPFTTVASAARPAPLAVALHPPISKGTNVLAPVLPCIPPDAMRPTGNPRAVMAGAGTTLQPLVVRPFAE